MKYVSAYRYEVNVAVNGWHVFATDSSVRNYTDEVVATLVLFLKDNLGHLPGFSLSVQAWDRQTGVAVYSTPPLVQSAIDGTVDRKRLAKAVEKQREVVRGMRQEHDNAFGEESA